jgi:hypothetical protein
MILTRKKPPVMLDLLTLAVSGACTAAGVDAIVTTATTRRAGHMAVTRARPTGGYRTSDVLAAIKASRSVPASAVNVSGSMFGGSVQVWWKDLG